MKERLKNYFKAGYPAVAIQTVEEARVIADILTAAREAEKSVLVWSAIEGGQVIEGDPKAAPGPDIQEALSVGLGDREGNSTMRNTVYVLQDLHMYPLNEDPELNQACKSLILRCKERGSTVVFLGCEFTPPATFARLVVVTDYLLPGRETIETILDGMLESVKEAGGDLELDNGKREQVIQAAMGMSTTECENALALSWTEAKDMSPEIIYREKVQAVKRSGLLEIIEPDPLGMDAVGGLDNLKEYIRQRKRAFSKEAREFGLPTPRGTLLVGLPGGGKSLSAKAVGTVLGIPTLRFDIGTLFGSLVGESERRTREALATADALAPIVLFVDEVNFSASLIR